ncbi:site-specific integrase [Saccharopolyspora endophytica]|uniref:Site-specific integrase n=1 Tax=Saccharopolyspora endophytica TaxID=543886 RepID=A0ABS5DEG9_9PSEU|nr:site-specific integrase [Saccharopolyspora endophytica]MBQ0924600.1 site-specific integrase [Saccharopolyspora endophytica]
MTERKKKSGRRVPGSVFPRGRKWAYKFYGPPDILTGERPEIRQSGFETEDDAWEAMLIARGALATETYVKPSRQTVSTFFESWFSYVRTTTEATTAANYENLARYYVLPIIGNRRMQDITPSVVAALYEHLLTKARLDQPNTNWEMYQLWKGAQERKENLRIREIAEKTGVTYAGARKAVRRYEVGRVPAEPQVGYAPKTVHSVHIMLGSAFSTAKAWSVVGANPMESVKAPSQVRRPHKTWSPGQMARFLEAARADRFYALWVLVASTGMRRSELCGLTRDGLDLSASGGATLRMNVTSVVAGGKVVSGGGKSKKSRRPVALDRYTTAVLTEHLERLDSERAAFGSGYQDNGLVFCWENGGRIYPDTITEKFNALVDRVSLPLITLHGVRHSYATIALRSGVHPKVVSSRLGHATVAFTLDTYAEDVPELDRDAAEDIGRLFLPKAPGEQAVVPGAGGEPETRNEEAIVQFLRALPAQYRQVLLERERQSEDAE